MGKGFGDDCQSLIFVDDASYPKTQLTLEIAPTDKLSTWLG